MFKHGAKPVIGLIGAIGAGKSAAAGCFASRGGFVIDADALGHEALRQPEIMAAIVSRWGEGVRKSDGSLDRRAIGRIVFANPAERSGLEALVFPCIVRRITEEIAGGMRNENYRFLVLDAAVLLEAGWNNNVDRIVYVDAPRQMRLARLAARSGWIAADLAAREAAQWPAETKKGRADAVLTNDSTHASLQEQVDSLLHAWKLMDR
ncbi:MAG TPA: dephospho-CoA kinase [Gemmata sp.]|nr:dephospho-CoA kinase [Gemmata sp.]